MQGRPGGQECQGGRRKKAPPQGARAGQVQVQRQRRVRKAEQVQVRARKGVQVQVLPQPQAAAARPAACPRLPAARIRPKGAITAPILCAAIFAMFGKMYSVGHMYTIMSKHNLASKKLSAIHINHAGCAAVRAWQRRLEVRLKKLRDVGYAICSFDECFMVRDKATGRMWIEKGKRLAQLYTGSRDRIVLFGYYFEDCTHRFQEYAFADSYALIDSLKRIGAEYGKVAIIMYRMSAHQAKVVIEFLREYRLAHPGRDIQLIFLPRGSPYLNVVEECWNLLKKAVAQYYYYPRFNDFRWAVSDHLRTSRYTMKMSDFVYRNPRLHLGEG